MSLKLHPLRVGALLLCTIIAAYVTKVYMGRMLGDDSVHAFLAFWAFFIALLAWSKPRIGAALWGLITLLFLVRGLADGWPRPWAVLVMTLKDLSLFLLMEVLLVSVAIFDSRHSK